MGKSTLSQVKNWLRVSQGGAVIVPESEIEHANNAIAHFADDVRDVKATMNVIYEYAEGSVCSTNRTVCIADQNADVRNRNSIL